MEAIQTPTFNLDNLAAGSKRRFELMKEDSVTLCWTSDTYKEYPAGSFVSVEGKIFMLMKKYAPAYNGGAYTYNMRLDADYYRLQYILFKLNPTKRAETSFTGTMKVTEWASLFVENMEAAGITGCTVVMAAELNGKDICITCSAISILDAFSMFAEQVNCEWWVIGSTVYFGKCIKESGITLSFDGEGKNVSEVNPSVSGSDYANTLYVYGAENNLPKTFGKRLEIAPTTPCTDCKGNAGFYDPARPLTASMFPASARGEVDTQTLSTYSTAVRSKYSTYVTGSSDIAETVSIPLAATLSLGKGRFRLNGSGHFSVTPNSHRVNSQKIKIALYGSEGNLIGESNEAVRFSPVPSGSGFAEAFCQLDFDFTIEGVCESATVCQLKAVTSLSASTTSGTSGAINGERSVNLSSVRLTEYKACVNAVAVVNNAAADITLYPIQGGENLCFPTQDRCVIKNADSRKIPGSYYTSNTDSTSVVAGAIQKRLTLPNAEEWAKIQQGYGDTILKGIDTTPFNPERGCVQILDEGENVIEKSVTDDSVYPNSQDTISAVELETGEDEDGFTTYTYYIQGTTVFKDFSEEYLLEGEDLQVNFGDNGANIANLNGLTFPAGLVTRKGETWIKVEQSNEYGAILPNATFKPEVGQKFSLLNYNAEYVDASTIYEAQARLVATSLDLLKTYKEKKVITYTFKMIMIGSGLTLADLTLGTPVTVSGGGMDGVESRVIGYEYKLDYPEDDMQLICGDSSASTRYGELEKKIDALAYTVSSTGVAVSTGGSSVEIIGMGDATAFSNTNVLSALRAKNEFISRLANDIVSGVIRFLSGLKIGSTTANDYGISAEAVAKLRTIVAEVFQTADFVSGDLGSGFAVYKDGNVTKMEVDELLVRRIAKFLKLEIRELAYVAGNIVLSNAGSEIASVEPVYDENGQLAGWKCSWCADDGKTSTTNTWIAGDQARCSTDNIKKPGTHDELSNRYYWRLVTEVGADYVILSASDHDSSTDNDNENCIPKAGDKLVQFGYRLGYNASESNPDDESNKDRTSLLQLSTNGTDAPSIKAYSGVVDYSLTEDRRIFLISPKGIVFNADYITYTSGGVEFPQRVYMGDWEKGTHAAYFTEWTYRNCSWLCVNADGTDDEPSLDSPDWKLIAGDPRTLVRRMRFQTEYGEFDTWIDFGDTVHFYAIIEDGLRNEYNDEYTGWTIRRHNGDTPDDLAADGVWNATMANISETGEFDLTWNESRDDLNAERATFIVEAQLKADQAKTVRGIFKI